MTDSQLESNSSRMTSCASLNIWSEKGPAEYSVIADIFWGRGGCISTAPEAIIEWYVDSSELYLDLDDRILEADSIAWSNEIPESIKEDIEFNKRAGKNVTLKLALSSAFRGTAANRPAAVEAGSDFIREGNLSEHSASQTKVEAEICLVRFIGIPERPVWQFSSADLSKDQRSPLGPHLNGRLSSKRLGTIHSKHDSVKIVGRLVCGLNNIRPTSGRLQRWTMLGFSKEKFLKAMIAKALGGGPKLTLATSAI